MIIICYHLKVANSNNGGKKNSLTLYNKSVKLILAPNKRRTGHWVVTKVFFEN